MYPQRLVSSIAIDAFDREILTIGYLSIKSLTNRSGSASTAGAFAVQQSRSNPFQGRTRGHLDPASNPKS